MTKRPDLTSYQRKIVGRFYDHKDTIHATKLGELVSEIAVESEPKKLDRLWKSAGEYLAKCGVAPAMIEAAVPRGTSNCWANWPGRSCRARPRRACRRRSA